MRAIAAHLSAAGAVVERDARVFVSYRARTVTQFFGLAMSMLIFYYVSQLVDPTVFGSPEAYFTFVATGLLVTNVLQSALVMPVVVRQELVAGTFQRLITSPFGAIAGLISMLIFPMLLSCVVATVGFIGVALIFDLPVTWSTAPLAVPVALLGALSFSTIGLVIAASVILFKQAPGVAAVLALLTLSSGVYFPIDLLPGWLSWIADVQPFTPAVELLRHLLIGSSGEMAPGAALLKLIAFVLLLIPVATFVLRLAVERSRKRGTILEY